MPPRRVIGIDAGGTKLLGGVLDEELFVHHRTHRGWRGGDRFKSMKNSSNIWWRGHSSSAVLKRLFQPSTFLVIAPMS